MRRVICILFALTLLTLAGCYANAQEYKEDNGLSVVATIFPPYDFARRILGDCGSVTMLLPPGSQSHSYEPTPQDIKRISECDVFLMIGGESEAWAQKVLAGVDTARMTVVRLIDCAKSIPHAQTHDHSHDDETHELPDEHIWTSPPLSINMAEEITKAFVKADPDKADVFNDNFDAFRAELEDLDELFRQITSDSVRDEIVFADRFPFLFFTNEYGLKYKSAFPGCAADAQPDAATVAALTRFIRSEAIPAVFYLELSSEDMADILIEGTVTKKLLFHSCHNVTAQEFASGASYLSLMRQNAQNLRIALN